MWKLVLTIILTIALLASMCATAMIVGPIVENLRIERWIADLFALVAPQNY